MDGKAIKELIFKKEKENIVVFEVLGELYESDMDELICQDAECILYDLNRDKLTCATWIEAEKESWINNYAIALVVERLKEKLEKCEKELASIKGEQKE